MNTPMNPTNDASSPVPDCAAPALRADLKAYLDDELPALRRRAVTSHLRRCASCRAEATAMEQITNDLKSAAGPAAALRPDLRRRLLSRIATDAPGADPSPAVPTSRVLPLWRRQPVLVFGGGAAFAALFLAVFLPIFSQSREKAAPRVAMAAGDRTSPFSQGGAATDTAGAPAVAPPAVTAGESKAAAAETANKAFRAPGGLRRDEPALMAEAPVQLAQAAEQTPALSRNFRAPAASAPPTAPAAADEAAAADDGRQVHKEGSISVAVEHLEAASDQVEQMVKAGGGYVAENNLTTDAGGFKAADLTVRVPVAQFEDAMKQIARLGDVTAKSVSGEDITEKLSDANQAATVLSDEVESSAARLRGFSGSDKERRYREADLRQTKIQLAQEQARLGLLRKMARLATIQVSLTEKAKRTAIASPPQGGFLADLHETNRAAAAAFSAAIRVPVILVIWVLAFSPLWVPLVILYRYAAIKSLARQAVAAATKPEPEPEMRPMV